MNTYPVTNSIAWLRKIEIRYRLMGSFILLSLLPLLVTGIISYSESGKSIEKNARIFSTEIVKQVAKNIQLQMAQVESDSQALVLSDPVQSALLQYASENDAERVSARADMTKILLDAYGSFDYINQKYFLGTDRKIMDAQVFPQLGAAVIRLVEQATGPKGRPYWTTLEVFGGDKSIVMLRDIYFKANGRGAGSLFLGVDQSHFADVFDNVDLGSGSGMSVLDSRTGSVLLKTASKPANAATTTPDHALLDDIRSSLAQRKSQGFLIYDVKSVTNTQDNPSGKYVAAYAQIARTSWFVVSSIPYENLLSEAKSVRNQIIVIGLLCFAASIVLAFVISRSISTPLEELIGSMKQAEKGNYAIRMTREGDDELSTLSQQFNDMATKIAQEHERLEERVGERTRDLEEANHKLASLSLTDGLTGIANRRHFDTVLLAELHRAARTGKPLALMMLDVDFFKNYNDHYGHQEGDVCLRKVARLMQSHARRASDLVARYGGEEFVMLAVDTDAASAMALAESIRGALEALALPHAKSPLAVGCVTTSIGVAVLIPDDEQTAEMFIRMADKAMYRAKEQGRNQVMLFGRDTTTTLSPV